MIPRQLTALLVVLLVFGIGFAALAQSPTTATDERAETFELTTNETNLSVPQNHSGIDSLGLVDANGTELIEGIDYEIDNQNATIAATNNSSAAGAQVRADYRVTVPDSQAEQFASLLSPLGLVLIGLTPLLVVYLIASRVFT